MVGFLDFVRGTSRRTAARTFFHTCALATDGVVALHQAAAFGEIWVHARPPAFAAAAGAGGGGGG